MRSSLAVILCTALAVTACDDGTDPDDDDDDGGDGTEEFSATLSPDNVVGQEIVSTGSGSATFELDSASGNLSYTITVHDIDHIIAAHIHAPATVTQNASIPLTLYSSQPTGEIDGQLVSGTIMPGSSQLTAGFTLADVVEDMRNGMAYVLVHSSEYPDGEIRGHIVTSD